jgi:hypothetical protein
MFSSISGLHISLLDQNGNQSFTINSWLIRGIGLSVPSAGNHGISYAKSSPLETGDLLHDSIDVFDGFVACANWLLALACQRLYLHPLHP